MTSKSSKRRTFHISTKLLSAGVLAGGVALGAGCKPEPEVTSNPAPITPPRASDELVEPRRVNPGPQLEQPEPVDPAPSIAPPTHVDPAPSIAPPKPVEMPIAVNPGQVMVPPPSKESSPQDMGQDAKDAPDAGLALPPVVRPRELDRAPYKPNVNTQHIRHDQPAPELRPAPSRKKP